MANEIIRQRVAARGINSVFHFTRLENLESIFRNGLQPRANLQNTSIPFYYNDCYRYDNCLNANSMSISFPNYKMFFKYRKEDEQADWVVIEFDSSVLSDFDCAFCSTNAAKGAMSSIPLDQRRSRAAFESMFYDNALRGCLGLPMNYTTDPQAEVLVFAAIPPCYIKNVYFANWNLAQAEAALFNTMSFRDSFNVNFSGDARYFSCRFDYRYWCNAG